MGSVYEIRLKGVVSARFLNALRAAHELRADTVLHGDIKDQAALHGLLARISDLGLELVDIDRIQHEAPPQEH